MLSCPQRQNFMDINPSVEQIKIVIAQLLKLYHEYIDLHERDKLLAREMEELAFKNQHYSQHYKKMVDDDPNSIIKFVGHIDALIKLSPALDLCISDHSGQLEKTLPYMQDLTKALNRIDEFIHLDMKSMSEDTLKEFHEIESAKSIELTGILPELERNHDSIRLRFNSIKKELGNFPSPLMSAE
jgi:hypothetical protein